MTGTIKNQGKIYQVFAEVNGVSQESQLDPSKIGGENKEEAPTAEDYGTPTVRGLDAINGTAQRQGGNNIDRCLFYSPAALKNAGAEPGMDNKGLAMEGNMNNLDQNSGLQTRKTVVYHGQTNWDDARLGP